jgi:hypothetical protein
MTTGSVEPFSVRTVRRTTGLASLRLADDRVRVDRERARSARKCKGKSRAVASGRRPPPSPPNDLDPSLPVDTCNLHLKSLARKSVRVRVPQGLLD